MYVYCACVSLLNSVPKLSVVGSISGQPVTTGGMGLASQLYLLCQEVLLL